MWRFFFNDAMQRAEVAESSLASAQEERRSLEELELRAEVDALSVDG